MKPALPQLTLALLLMASPAAAVTLDFEEFDHGDRVTSSQGVTIRTVNYSGPDIGVAFDSNASGTADPDLQRNSSGSMGWEAGNLAPSTDLGNLLIIQEHSYSCGSSSCYNPDDEGDRPAGYFDLDFSALGSFVDFSMDLVDVESYTAEPGYVRFYLGGVQVATRSFMSFLTDPSVVYGDNSANHIDVISGIEFDRVVIRMGGSGGVDNIVAGSPVPEPSAALLFAVGSTGAAAYFRRRERASSSSR